MRCLRKVKREKNYTGLFENSSFIPRTSGYLETLASLSYVLGKG